MADSLPPRSLILASASQRRIDILTNIDCTPAAIIPADIDETPHRKELPAEYVVRMARSKGEVIRGSLLNSDAHSHFILSADTIVATGKKILQKAKNASEVRSCLMHLSGRWHDILTAVSLITPEGVHAQRLVKTRIRYKRLDHAEIEWYCKSDEGIGKAGGYHAAGKASVFITDLKGSHSAVLGLPAHEVHQLLLGNGYRYDKP